MAYIDRPLDNSIGTDMTLREGCDLINDNFEVLAADKLKLNSIEPGAQVNSITSVAGQTGDVVLTKFDVGLNNVDNVQQAPITRTINAGTGLTGGGDLTVDRTLSVSYGTTAGTAAQGNDSRIVNAVPNSRTITAGTGLTGGGDLTTNRTLSVTYGNTTGTATQGNDPRLSDSREWTAATIDQAEAEAGTATTRRAWTAQRVRQAITAWWVGSAEKTKLDGIATGATKNDTDANLKDRANHTGTQAISTVSGLQGALDGKEPVFTKNTAFNKNFGTTTDTVTQGDDSRLSNSREWTAETISQAEAEAGTATTRRAFTAERVRQAVVAWFNGVSGALGRTILTRTTGDQVRSDIGLGTAATTNVATNAEALAGTAGVLPDAASVRAVIAQDAPSKTGAGASGIWDINITGSVETAISAAKWTTARTITLGGDLSGSVTIDGNSDVTLSAQVGDNSHNHTSLSGKVLFTGSTGNDYHNSNIELQGNGPANTVKPSIGFYQPTLYAGTLSQLDGNTFQFTRQDGNPAILANDITGIASRLTSYPVGATYIQFPGYSSPSSLFGGTWSQLFNTEGVFFRTEGGNASAFGGGVQGDLFRSHSHYVPSGAYGAGYAGYKPGYGWANAMRTGAEGGDETRPINRTIRVWVRTA